jgi:hypothetical protein
VTTISGLVRDKLVPVVAFAAGAALVTGIAQAGPFGAAANRDSAVRWLETVEPDYGKAANFGSLMRETRSVAQVTVESIEGPFWNSVDGGEWEGTDAVPQRVYSRVHVHVDDVWIGQRLPESFSFLVLGDARERVETTEVPPYGAISGGFVEGDSFVVALKQLPFIFEDGERVEWTLAAQFEANWRIQGDRAVGADLTRSMPVGELRERVRQNGPGAPEAGAP